MSKFKHALIVDDSRLARDGLSALLEATGLSVVQAGTAAAALALLKSSPVDVIFMDSRMPDCEPYEVVRSLTRQSSTASIPVVICATKDAAAEREKARKSGARGFLVKPITGRVVDKILEFLEQAGPADLSAELQQDLGGLDAENLPVLELPENEADTFAPLTQPTEAPPLPGFNGNDYLPELTVAKPAQSVASKAPETPETPATRPVYAAPAMSKVSAESVDDILDQIRASVQEIARKAAQTAVLKVVPALVEKTAGVTGQQAGQEAGQKAGYQAGHEAGQLAGQQAGHQSGHQAGQQAGHQAGYQAGKQAGEQAGHQTGSQAGEKVARALIDHVVEEELNQWKSTAKTEVYDLLQSRMVPLVRKLAKEIATQEANEVAVRTATETAREEADTVARKVAAELSRTISKGVASEAAQATALQVTGDFSVQWRRKLIRHTVLVGVLSASISLGMAFLFHKFSYLF